MNQNLLTSLSPTLFSATTSLLQLSAALQRLLLAITAWCCSDLSANQITAIDDALFDATSNLVLL